MKLSKTAKNMILVIIVSSAAFIVACALYYRSFAFIPFAVGVLMGAGLNIIKVAMLENAVNHAITLEQKEAANYLKAQYFFRFILTGAVLAAAAVIPDKFVSLWGAAAGIVTLQIAAYAMKFFVHDEFKKPGEEITVPEDEEESVTEAEAEEIIAAEGTEEDATITDEEKKRIRKKPSGQSADKRMKRKPTRHYR